MAEQFKRSEIGYTGVSFPFRLAPTGKVATSTVNLSTGVMQHIVEAIVQIIRTIRGERFFRRSFGAEPVHVVFRPNTEVEMMWMASELQDILAEYEPRVSLIEATIVEQDPDQGFVKMRLGFKHNATQITDYIEVTV